VLISSGDLNLGSGNILAVNVNGVDVTASGIISALSGTIGKDFVVVGEATMTTVVVAEGLSAGKVVVTENIETKKIGAEEGGFKTLISESGGEVKLGGEAFKIGQSGEVSFNGENVEIKGKLNVDNEVAARSITVSGVSSFEGLTSSGNAEIGGDLDVKGGATFEGVLKSTSVMATRAYLDDVTATGFVLAGEMKSKGKIEAEGVISGGELVSKGEVSAKNVVATDKVTALR